MSTEVKLNAIEAIHGQSTSRAVDMRSDTVTKPTPEMIQVRFLPSTSSLRDCLHPVVLALERDKTLC